MRRGRGTRPGRAASATCAGLPRPQRLHRLARLGRQVGGVGVVDRDPHRRARQARGPVRPGRAHARPTPRRPAPSSRAATSASSAPPTTAAPRSGAFGGRGGASIPASVWLGARIVAPANDRLASAARCRPGTYSSRTAWKLVPPKPNALTPAHAHAARGCRPLAQLGVDPERDRRPSRRFGLGCSKCRLGASTLSCRLSTVLKRPAAPAAALRWPMLDLTEPSAIEPGCGAGLAEHLGRGWPAPWRRRRGWTCRAPRRRWPSAGSSAGVVPGALHRQPLADRVGRGDALAAAVAGARRARAARRRCGRRRARRRPGASARRARRPRP